jgi:anaerobic selenocysteine-containing dehydrogenase
MTDDKLAEKTFKDKFALKWGCISWDVLLSSIIENGMNEDSLDAMIDQYHEAKLKEITDEDIEAWVTNSRVPHEDYIKLHTVDVARTCLIIGAKAFRNGEIKHIEA